MENKTGKSWIIPAVIIVAIIAAGFLFYFYTLKPPAGLANDASENTSRKYGSIKWYSYEDGLALGKKQGKKVFLFFWAEWCRYCIQMDRETFSSSQVVAYLNDYYISVKVDFDREKRTASDYFISGVPTSWFLSENGERISNLPGYVPADTFLPVLKFIHSDSYKTMTFAKYLKTI